MNLEQMVSKYDKMNDGFLRAADKLNPFSDKNVTESHLRNAGRIPFTKNRGMNRHRLVLESQGVTDGSVFADAAISDPAKRFDYQYGTDIVTGAKKETDGYTITLGATGFHLDGEGLDGLACQLQRVDGEKDLLKHKKYPVTVDGMDTYLTVRDACRLLRDIEGLERPKGMDRALSAGTMEDTMEEDGISR